MFLFLSHGSWWHSSEEKVPHTGNDWNTVMLLGLLYSIGKLYSMIFFTRRGDQAFWEGFPLDYFEENYLITICELNINPYSLGRYLLEIVSTSRVQKQNSKEFVIRCLLILLCSIQVHLKNSRNVGSFKEGCLLALAQIDFSRIRTPFLLDISSFLVIKRNKTIHSLHDY